VRPVTWTGGSLRASVDETRRELRRQGFRTELSNFNFALSAEINVRASAITSVAHAVQPLRAIHEIQLMERVGSNAALAISSVEVIETDRATNLWPVLRQELIPHDGQLNTVCASLSAGPIQFPLDTRGDIRLPHLADYRRLASVLAVRSVLAMHERNSNVMFTNLFALTRMVTAWIPEPTDVSHLVRFAVVSIAEQAIWESVQTDCRNEDRLIALQREWESVRFFDQLPETAELSCANMLRICHNSRQDIYSEQIGGWGQIFRALLSFSGWRNLWETVKGYRGHVGYRNHGSYEDEKALMLYFRDRHQELKRAIACSTWAEMRPLPGGTNRVEIFQGAKHSRIVTIMNLKHLTQGVHAGSQPLIARAAEAETKRRLIVTALALERFALHHKEYPASLTNLMPAFLSAVPADFMDGQPLRYRRFEDGRYVLYSVGLDGVDNGGQIVSPEFPAASYRRREPMFLPHFNTDLVWPKSATQSELDLFERQTQEPERRLLE
jgi:hypothetical protein